MTCRSKATIINILLNALSALSGQDPIPDRLPQQDAARASFPSDNKVTSIFNCSTRDVISDSMSL